MEKKLKDSLINLLRRASYRSSFSNRNDCLKDARLGRNEYICAECGPTEIYGRRDVQVDHVNPVVPIEGFTGFDDFIENLFCPIEDLQVLCKVHHKEKTQAENQQRKEYKKMLKNIRKCVKVEINDDMYIQYLIDRFGIENVMSYLKKEELIW